MSAKAWSHRKTSGFARCQQYGHSEVNLTPGGNVAFLVCMRCGLQHVGANRAPRNFLQANELTLAEHRRWARSLKARRTRSVIPRG